MDAESRMDSTDQKTGQADPSGRIELPNIPERRSPMPDKIETVPEKTRWEIATKGLTGAYIAISNALRRAAGQNRFEEFNGSLWYEAGKGAKGFADTFGLAAADARDVEGIMHLFAKAAMGPEFTFEVAEASKDRWRTKKKPVSCFILARVRAR